MTANPYEEGSLQHEMWNNIRNKKVEKEKINYVESLKELIKIEKKSKQEAIFSEKYLRQLERRIEIFHAGETEAIKDEIVFNQMLLDFAKEDWLIKMLNSRIQKLGDLAK